MREPGGWIDDWWTVVHVIVFVVMVSLSVLWTGWVLYLESGVAFHALLSVLFWARWSGTPNAQAKVYSMTIGWPVSIILFVKIVRREERLRKIRMIQEVMEE